MYLLRVFFLQIQSFIHQPPDTPQSHESADIPMATPPFASIFQKCVDFFIHCFSVLLSHSYAWLEQACPSGPQGLPCLMGT